MLTLEVTSAQARLWFDLTSDGLVNSDDAAAWVHEVKGPYFGDANLDGELGSGDLTEVFQAGEYEDNVAMNSTWATGDWKGDLEFDTGALVTAFQDGGYEMGAMLAAAVPEPSSTLSLLIGSVALFRRRTTIRRCARTSSSRTNSISLHSNRTCPPTIV